MATPDVWAAIFTGGVIVFWVAYQLGEWMRQRKIDSRDNKPMRRGRARKRLRQIWREQHPGCMTIEEAFVTPEPWKWFNIYANLQNHNPTLQAVCDSFTETRERLSKEKHHLEEIIGQQRAELKKRCSELEKLKAGAGLRSGE